LWIRARLVCPARRACADPAAAPLPNATKATAIPAARSALRFRPPNRVPIERERTCVTLAPHAQGWDPPVARSEGRPPPLDRMKRPSSVHSVVTTDRSRSYLASSDPVTLGACHSWESVTTVCRSHSNRHGRRKKSGRVGRDRRERTRLYRSDREYRSRYTRAEGI